MPRVLLQGVPAMLCCALVFLVVALIAGLLGFGGVAAVSTDIAQIPLRHLPDRLRGATLLMHAFRRR